MRGRLVWVLHAHLPFVRHPEHPRFFEEDWLFEAIERCYLPLLQVLEGWRRDRIQARISISLSPTLVDMLQDELLQARFRAHLDRRTALLAEERRRLATSSLHELALLDTEQLFSARALYERLGGSIVRGFSQLAHAGVVELWTTAATHALLPLMTHRPEFVRAQVRVGVESHRRAFGHRPAGFWLPECGWFEGVDRVLAEFGLRYTVLEGTALRLARPPPMCGVFRGVASPSGVLVLGRDSRCAERIWSKEIGYPGDGRYQDFHRDSTWERSFESVQPYILPSGVRVPLGLRYHRVTERNLALASKAAYDPGQAMAAARSHAEHFVDEQVEWLGHLGAEMGMPASTVAPFDAELFGHWWREGPAFLDLAVRASVGRLDWVSGSDLLASGEAVEMVQPAVSTWGEGSDASVWLSPDTAWLWPQLLDAVDDLERTAAFASRGRPLLRRAHAQLCREVFLAAASDWPFLIHMKSAVDYASSRVRAHIERAALLTKMIDDDRIEPRRLARLEAQDDIFPWLEYEP